MRTFIETWKALRGLAPGEPDSARDVAGHGTHVAATAAGNRDVPAVLFGLEQGRVSGIAPRAHIAAYRMAGGEDGGGLGAFSGTVRSASALVRMAIAGCVAMARARRRAPSASSGRSADSNTRRRANRPPGPGSHTSRRKRFEAEWQFSSMVRDAEQPGLSVVASPDRGDGARMSWVRMADTPGGLEVAFYDDQRGATVDPCGCCPPFVCTVVATGLDRSRPHKIKLVMDFVEGDSNDVVKLYVDNKLVHTGTSWEDYFRDNEDGLSRTVDSLLFRAAGAAAPLSARAWRPGPAPAPGP